MEAAKLSLEREQSAEGGVQCLSPWVQPGCLNLRQVFSFAMFPLLSSPLAVPASDI